MILITLSSQDAHAGFLDCHPGKHNPLLEVATAAANERFHPPVFVITGKIAWSPPYTLNFLSSSSMELLILIPCGITASLQIGIIVAYVNINIPGNGCYGDIFRPLPLQGRIFENI